MKATSVIICALLIFGAVAMTEEEETFQTLEKIETSKFGKTILDTIQIQLASGDPVENLIELLKDIENQLVTEQKTDDLYIKDMRGKCESDETRLTQEISSTGQKIDELKAELDEKIPVREEKTGIYNDKVAEAEQIQDRIGELDDSKSERDSEWTAVAEEHDRATYVIENAKQMLERGFGGAFLEQNSKATVFAQLGDHFAKSADMKFTRTPSWSRLFKVLATIASSSAVQADGSAVNKILELADDLLEQIADSREVERKEHDAWTKEYQETRAREITKLQEVDATIANVQAEVSALNKRITIAQDEREEQLNRLKQKKIELVEREQFCDDESDSYQKRRQSRGEDIGVVSECIGLIESKIRLLKQFVAQRLG